MTRTHGIDKDLWYRQGLMVLTTPMVLTHGIESVILNHTRLRGLSVTRMRDFSQTIKLYFLSGFSSRRCPHMKLNCVQIFYDVCESHFPMFYCLNSVSKQGFLCLPIHPLPDLRTTSLLEFVTRFVLKAPFIGPVTCHCTQSDSLDCRPWSF